MNVQVGCVYPEIELGLKAYGQLAGRLKATRGDVFAIGIYTRSDRFLEHRPSADKISDCFPGRIFSRLLLSSSSANSTVTEYRGSHKMMQFVKKLLC